MQRVLVLGSSGSGKSTFARQLGQTLGVRVIHLDSHYWQPHWVATPADEWARKLDGLLQQESWVMDGNYTGSLEARLSFADTVVFLDVHRVVCLWRCVKRLAENRGRNREELAPGCYEKMDREFFEWIWRYPRDVRPRITRLLDEHAGDRRVVVLRSSGEVADFLARVRAEMEPGDDGDVGATHSP